MTTPNVYLLYLLRNTLNSPWTVFFPIDIPYHVSTLIDNYSCPPQYTLSMYTIAAHVLL